ncbi:MAG: hypothetical protein PVG65_07040, partial [Candidatus Thorarchaeota archaeon]
MSLEDEEFKQCDYCHGTGIDPKAKPKQICEKCQGKKSLDWIENITGVRKIDDIQKSILYCVKTLNELCVKGILKGGAFELSERALTLIKGFEP